MPTIEWMSCFDFLLHDDQFELFNELRLTFLPESQLSVEYENERFDTCQNKIKIANSSFQTFAQFSLFFFKFSNHVRARKVPPRHPDVVA